jgi:hypothetical protein
VQLTSRSFRILAVGFAFACAWLAHDRSAHAQVAEFNTTHTVYYEAPAKTHMFVYSPAADLKVTPIDALDVRAGWEADVVSGASVAVKAGPAYAATHPGSGADVITTASVHDFRNVAHGGFTVRHDVVSLDADYSYSTEHDYKSHTVSVGARTDLFEHNTQLAISYARNFDFVCNRTQSPTALPSQYTALENSDGCFTGGATPSRLTDQIAIDGFQASWSQSLTPTFAMQFVYTGQITNGFQSDPYRSVIIGEGLKAQEHVPDNRTRNAFAVRGNLFLKPLKAALRIGARAYDDTWDIKSGTVDAEFEKYFGERFRAVARARFYKQSGALFWSDDYSGGNAPLGPKGQYFTGDRELSPFESILVGLGATYAVTPQKRVLGLMSGFKFSLNGDVIQFIYNDYTLAGSEVSGSRALMASLSMTLVF